ncbi:hypothetical protein RINTHM_3310 [Richelia intracellularis HM01]|nr:hypothetical protein RINTHM_3310 [Richelia intracellularis HM01]
MTSIILPSLKSENLYGKTLANLNSSPSIDNPPITKELL